jgi:formylglycine-generating enzyme required for sulfatase activity
VAKKAPNPWGLHDVHGNVWEWVQDCWHENYEEAPTDGSAWEEEGGGDCGRRVVRGGSWNSYPEYLRSAFRSGFTAA